MLIRSLLAILMLISITGLSQAPSSYCVSEILLQQEYNRNPDFKNIHDQHELDLYSLFDGRPLVQGTNRQVYTIPVVVHIIHNNGIENISDARIEQGIQHLNDAFRNVGVYDPATGVDMEIEFCLASQTPGGNTTNGITRTQSPLTDMYVETQDLTLKNLSRWAPTQYLNIWVIKEIRSLSVGSGVAGYAYFPSSHGTAVDGIVCETRYFGVSSAFSTVHIHEAGHYLGMYHTFQGGCANNNCLQNGDRVCDTPPDNTGANLPCGANINSCSTDEDDLSSNNPFRPVGLGGLGDQNDSRINYMDYGNIYCFSGFTQGQKNRAVASLTGIRNSLLASDGCASPCPVPVTAAFSASATYRTSRNQCQFYEYFFRRNYL